MYEEVPKQVIDQIRQTNDIVDVIEQYVHLEKRGNNYFGLCPFHDEKTPSFSVTKEKQIFHCFGCGKGGNVITFMMEIETLSFIEAVQFLADRAGISLPSIRPAKKLHEDDETLLAAFDWLTKYYHHLLKYADHAKEGRTYLEHRGIEEATIDTFQIGLAPIESDVTVKFLASKDLHLQFLVKAGLLSTRDANEYFDPFRGRVIFPIKNHQGQTVAFGARAIHGESPKYLNSREHTFFQKGSILFNFHAAKNHIRKQREVILFEGYLDVISAHQAGIKNVVATLGTALTEQQARLLRRYVDTVTICYDGDEAGQKASFEAAKLLQKIGCTIKIAQLKDDMDPDEYILTYGSEKFLKNVIDQSNTFFKFFMSYARKSYNVAVESERFDYIETLLEQLAKVDSSIERDFYLNEISDEFNVSIDVLQTDLQKHLEKNKQVNMDNSRHFSNNKRKPVSPLNIRLLPAYHNAEKKLLSYMLQDPIILEKVQERLGTRFNLDEHKIILTHLYALYEENHDISLSELIDKLEDESLRKLVTELAFRSLEAPLTEEELNDCILVIEREATDVNYLRTLKRKQREEQNPLIAAQIGLEIVELEKKLKKS